VIAGTALPREDRAMDEAALLAKLARIEALFARGATAGERAAAGEARQRILARLRETEREERPIEFRFRLDDPWARRLFLALLRRYGIRPYRNPRQRRTTVMARVTRSFVDTTLWPEFTQIEAVLRQHLDEITTRIVHQAIHEDSSDAEETPETAALANASDDSTTRA
jgi:hypothetical protein